MNMNKFIINLLYFFRDSRAGIFQKTFLLHDRNQQEYKILGLVGGTLMKVFTF